MPIDQFSCFRRSTTPTHARRVHMGRRTAQSVKRVLSTTSKGMPTPRLTYRSATRLPQEPAKTNRESAEAEPHGQAEQRC